MRYGGPEWWFMNGRGSDEFLAAQKASLVRDIIDGVGAAACMVSPFLSSATFWRCILLSVLAGAVAIFTIWALALIVIFSFYGF